ncbi:hypothetical protein ASPCAL04592 [Aspergillus calidoustus]|uniref:Transferase family protein n=1 Tax=Aspergillus calidoustus TaxID=454130 RepID=A0A0U5FYM2_ASPCI|nr:hypothetical protein ASPCAL04592 [Aspergillus calidoustus]
MEIIPVALPDQLKPINIIRTRTCFILDKRLDENILKDALNELIRTHGGNKRLEYHLPETFEEQYVLFSWSSKEDEKSFWDIASSLDVHDCKGVTFLPPVDAIEDAFIPSTWPTSRKDEPPDAPLLYVHLTFATDATVIATSLPHTVADQYGLGNVMKAWLGLVEGEIPPPMVGHSDDALPKSKPYNAFPKNVVFRKGRMRVRRRMEHFFVILGLIPDIVKYKEEPAHIVFFPRRLIRSLQERHQHVLRDTYGPDTTISEGDILTAIITKFSRMYDRKPRTIALFQSINLRGRHPDLPIGESDGFIHNSLHYATARFRINASTPVSEIAYWNRQAIIQALREEDIDIGMSVTREMVRRGQPIHICEPFERFYSISNWCGAWKGLDFRGAVAVEEHGQEERTLLDVDMLVVGQGNKRGAPRRFRTSIMCKTSEGFYCDFSAPLRALS